MVKRLYMKGYISIRYLCYRTEPEIMQKQFQHKIFPCTLELIYHKKYLFFTDTHLLRN